MNKNMLNEIRTIIREEIGAFRAELAPKFEAIDAQFEESKNEMRKFGVLLEQTNDNVQMIAEQYGEIKQTLKEHGEKLDVHTEMIAELAVDMTIVKEDVAVLKEDMREVRGVLCLAPHAVV